MIDHTFFVKKSVFERNYSVFHRNLFRGKHFWAGWARIFASNIASPNENLVLHKRVRNIFCVSTTMLETARGGLSITTKKYGLVTWRSARRKLSVRSRWFPTLIHCSFGNARKNTMSCKNSRIAGPISQHKRQLSNHNYGACAQPRTE